MTTNDDSINEAIAEVLRLEAESTEPGAWDIIEEHTYYRTAAPVLAREVQRLQAEIQPRIERSIAFQDAMEEAEAERDEARAEVERLQAERDAAYRDGQEAMRDRCAALCDDLEEDTCCEGWREMEQGAQHCAEAIRALEVEL